MNILLVEDDELLGDSIRFGLIQNQYTVDWVKDGLAAWYALQTEHFDLLILDLNLPKLSGDEVLKNVRTNNIAIPVIILTAYDAVCDRVKGLDSGADDYVTKPFNFEELCARIRAVIRRSCCSNDNSTLTIENITLDPITRLVFKSGQMVELSRREFMLLQVLFENVGKLVSREQVRQSLYSYDYDIDSNAVEVHIHNLRKKLKCKNISTVRGEGYAFKLSSKIFV